MPVLPEKNDRRTWTKPTLSRLPAGAAKNAAGLISDNTTSFS